MHTYVHFATSNLETAQIKQTTSQGSTDCSHESISALISCRPFAYALQHSVHWCDSEASQQFSLGMAGQKKQSRELAIYCNQQQHASSGNCNIMVSAQLGSTMAPDSQLQADHCSTTASCVQIVCSEICCFVNCVSQSDRFSQESLMAARRFSHLQHAYRHCPYVCRAKPTLTHCTHNNFV